MKFKVGDWAVIKTNYGAFVGDIIKIISTDESYGIKEYTGVVITKNDYFFKYFSFEEKHLKRYKPMKIPKYLNENKRDNNKAADGDVERNDKIITIEDIQVVRFK